MFRLNKKTVAVIGAVSALAIGGAAYAFITATTQTSTGSATVSTSVNRAIDWKVETTGAASYLTGKDLLLSANNFTANFESVALQVGAITITPSAFAATDTNKTTNIKDLCGIGVTFTGTQTSHAIPVNTEEGNATTAAGWTAVSTYNSLTPVVKMNLSAGTTTSDQSSCLTAVIDFTVAAA